jgi:HNH endonuclease
MTRVSSRRSIFAQVAKPCACGCGQNARSQYLRGHFIRKMWAERPRPLCKCGCGGYAERGRVFIPGHRTGQFVSNWKGGKRHHKDRYVWVLARNHPRASVGYVMEHTLVAERALGHYLPTGAVVHHVDGNKWNNTPTNLVICQDQAYHVLLHKRQRALARGRLA